MASAVIAFGLTAASYTQQRKAGKEQRRVDQANKRRAEVQNARSRRQTIAQGNIARAQTVAQGVNQGTGGGSAAQGAAGSVVSSTAAGVGFSQQLEGIDRAAFSAQSRANNAIGRSNSFQALNTAVQPFAPKIDQFVNSFRKQ